MSWMNNPNSHDVIGRVRRPAPYWRWRTPTHLQKTTTLTVLVRSRHSFVTFTSYLGRIQVLFPLFFFFWFEMNE